MWTGIYHISGEKLERRMEGYAFSPRENVVQINWCILAGVWERLSSWQCVTQGDVGMQLFQVCAVALLSPVSSQVPPRTGVRLNWLLTNMWLWVKALYCKRGASLCQLLFYYCFIWILISFVLDRSAWGEAKSSTKEGKGKVVQTHQSLRAAQFKVLELGCCGCWSSVNRFLSLLLLL